MPKKRIKLVRQVQPIMHIFCEGEKTEPNYLRRYIENNFSYNTSRRKVISIEPTNKTTPLQLVNEAINFKHKKDLTPDDTFWVVYDRESIRKYPDSLHNQAMNVANRNNINVVISNVCFELWILLHFIQNTTYYESCDDLLNKSPLRHHLEALGIRSYSKSDEKLFSLISEHINDAKIRAKQMNGHTRQHAERDNMQIYQLNPFTNFYELLDAIDSFQ
jgi:hypothetical protein